MKMFIQCLAVAGLIMALWCTNPPSVPASEVVGGYTYTSPSGEQRRLVFARGGIGLVQDGRLNYRIDWQQRGDEIWIGLLDGGANPLEIYKVIQGRLVRSGMVYLRD